jgi:hypothetical protein
MVLVLAVLVALEAPMNIALLVAVVGGFIVDVASGANFGLWTGLGLLIVLTGVWVRQAGVELDGWLVPILMVAGATCLLDVALGVGVWSITGGVSAGWWLERYGAELVLNLIAVVVLRRPIRWMSPEWERDT